jgi:hypothetical protein
VLFNKEVVRVTTAVRETATTVSSVLHRVENPRDVALRRIRKETGCSRSEAKRALNWINQFVILSRNEGYGTIYPTDEQMDTREYQIFDQIMAHGKSAIPDSAHAAVEDYLLDRSAEEVSILHDQRDEEDSPRYCTVQVCINVIR